MAREQVTRWAVREVLGAEVDERAALAFARAHSCRQRYLRAGLGGRAGDELSVPLVGGDAPSLLRLPSLLIRPRAHVEKGIQFVQVPRASRYILTAFAAGDPTFAH